MWNQTRVLLTHNVKILSVISVAPAILDIMALVLFVMVGILFNLYFVTMIKINQYIIYITLISILFSLNGDSLKNVLNFN